MALQTGQSGAHLLDRRQLRIHQRYAGDVKHSLVRMRQDEDFSRHGIDGRPAGFQPGRPGDGGQRAIRVLTSRLTRDLNVLANVSYLHNDDKTPRSTTSRRRRCFPATTPTSYTNINQPGIPGAVWFNNHTSKKDKTLGRRQPSADQRIPRHQPAWTTGSAGGTCLNSRVEEALAAWARARKKPKPRTVSTFAAACPDTDQRHARILGQPAPRLGLDQPSTLDPTQPTPNTAINTYLINTYCGGRACCRQVLPADVLIQLNANTPFP